MTTSFVRSLAAAFGLTSIFGVEAAPPSKNDPSAGPGRIILQQSTIGGRVIIQGRGGEVPSVIIDPTARVRGGIYHVDQFGRTTVITPRTQPLAPRIDNNPQQVPTVPLLPSYCVNPLRFPSVTQFPSVTITTNRICPAGTVDTRVNENVRGDDSSGSDNILPPIFGREDVFPSTLGNKDVVPNLEGRPTLPFAVFKTNVRDVFCLVSGGVVPGDLNSSCQTHENGTFRVANPYAYNVGFTDKTVVYCKRPEQIGAATKSYLESRDIPTWLQTQKECLMFKFG